MVDIRQMQYFVTSAQLGSFSEAALFSEFVTAHEVDNGQFRYREGGVEQVMDWVSGHETQLGFVFVPLNKQAAFRYLLELSEGLLADVLPGRMLDQVVMTNSDHMVIHLLRETDLCNLGTYWRHDRCSSEGISMISIDGCEETIGFGYLKRKGEALDGFGAGFLEQVDRVCGKDGAVAL